MAKDDTHAKDPDRSKNQFKGSNHVNFNECFSNYKKKWFLVCYLPFSNY